MKTLLKLFAIIVLFSNVACAQSKSVKTEAVKVWGNCNMCKKTIEEAADLKGVKNAEWNKDTKVLTVSYDTTKITLDDIQKKIAAAGYDTEKFKADDKAYDELHGCCKYDRKKE